MAVIYEELMENPEGEYLPYSQLTMSQMPFFLETVRRLFTVLSLSSSHVPAALEALNHDSQFGVLGKRGTDQIRISPATWAKCDALLKECDVPVSSSMTEQEFIRLMKL